MASVDLEVCGARCLRGGLETWLHGPAKAPRVKRPRRRREVDETPE